VIRSQTLSPQCDFSVIVLGITGQRKITAVEWSVSTRLPRPPGKPLAGSVTCSAQERAQAMSRAALRSAFIVALAAIWYLVDYPIGRLLFLAVAMLYSEPNWRRAAGWRYRG